MAKGKKKPAKSKNAPSRENKTAKEPAAEKKHKTGKGGVNLYTLKVALEGGRITPEFAKNNPACSRTIQMRGNQTLERLHLAIFEAFDRDDEHLYEFQFGRKPQERGAPRYTCPDGLDEIDVSLRPTGITTKTTLDSLSLKEKQSFWYWFDFGDDWWHKITVLAVKEDAPPGDYPKVTERVGDSPPQYPGDDEESGEEENEDDDEDAGEDGDDEEDEEEEEDDDEE